MSDTKGHEVPREAVLARVRGLKEAAEALWRRADRIEDTVGEETATYLREGAEALADKAYRYADAVDAPKEAKLSPEIMRGIQKRSERTGDRGMVLYAESPPEGVKVVRLE